MPTLGKTHKGRATLKDSNNKGGDPITLEAEHIHELEMRRRDESLLKVQLNAVMQHEARNSEWAQREVMIRWMDILRSEKLGELREELQAMMHMHDRAVERKSTVIQMLMQDIDEADAQYRLALRTHMERVDALLELYAQQMGEMTEFFSADLNDLYTSFQKDAAILTQEHMQHMQQLNIVLSRVTREAQALEAELVTEFSQQKDEATDRTNEEYNVLRQSLEGEVLSVQNTISREHELYVEAAAQKLRQYDELLHRDKTTAERIDAQVRRIRRLHDAINALKTSIANHIRDAETKNIALRSEKEQASNHMEALKSAMQRWRMRQETLLAALVEDACDAKKTLTAKVEEAETIVHLHQMCSALETERERVLSRDFTVAEVSAEVASRVTLTEDLAVKRAALRTSDEPDTFEDNALALDGLKQGVLLPGAKPLVQPDQALEWESLDAVWNRYNKVMLDVTAVEQERAHLAVENARLRALVKQCADGVTITPDIMQQPNSLLVTSQKPVLMCSSIKELGIAPGLVPVVDGREVR